MEMDKAQYLDEIGWKPEMWTVLTAEEAEPFKAIKGYQNYMYDQVKDPIGIKSFGKGAMICKIAWIEEKKAEVQQPEAKEEPKAVPPPPPAPKPESSVPPPPPQTQSAVPPPPPAPKEQAEPEVQKKEWPGFVKTRVGNLTVTGKWKYIGEDTIQHEDGRKLTYGEIEEYENHAFTDLVKEANGTKEEEKPDENEREERGNKRLTFLINNGLEPIVDKEDSDLVIAVEDPNGREITWDMVADMPSDVWMKLTVEYSAKAVRDMKTAKEEAELRKIEAEEKLKAEQEKEEKAKQPKEAEKPATEMTEEQYLKEQGWGQAWTVLRKGDWEHLANKEGFAKSVMAITDKIGIAQYGEDARLVNKDFLEKAGEPKTKVEVPTEDIKKALGEDLTDEEVKAAIEQPEPKEEKPVKVSEQAKESAKEQAVEKLKQSAKTDTGVAGAFLYRSKLAKEIMLAMVPSTKKGPEKIAEFAYQLADEMIKRQE